MVAEPREDPRAKGARNPVTINLFSGECRKDGSPVVEEVLVDQLDGNRYLALASPGLLEGLAAGDEFETVPQQGGTGFRVLKHGGNVSVQFFARADVLRECERFLLDKLRPIGGRLDGKDKLLLVWTIPVAAGFPAIEKPFYEAQQRFPNCEWMFGNVYAKDGKTQLNWWK